jgi:hypothetical protein
MKPTFNRSIAYCFLSPVFAIPAAAGANQRDDEAAACRGDAMKFCSAEIPNEDKITACMKQHVKELTPKCRSMVAGKKSS